MTKLPMLDTDELSDFIHISPDTLRYWRHMGKGPRYFKMGGRKVYYRQEDVDAWLKVQYEASNRAGLSVA
jgi:predicted DNA-binding transcriptional regulator AlpA